MSKTSEIELLKAGSEEAFRDLVMDYRSRVYNLCFGFVQNPADAEDVSQEVFLELYRSIGRFRGEARISTWLYRIAVTKSLEHLRRRKRRRWLSLFREEAREVGRAAATQNPGADEMLEQEDRKKLLELAMEKLPESQRIALSLKSFEGLSYKEISEVMNVSVSSVESLIFRARTNLMKRLSGYFSRRAKKARKFSRPGASKKEK